MKFGRVSMLLVATGLVAGCASGLGDTLSTDVSAQGDEILLTWEEDHPWDQRLQREPISLIAEYRQKPSGNWVKQPMDRGRATRGQRSIRFSLGDKLPSRPTGDICLLFQMANGVFLPVRQAEKGGGDTARFTYPVWGQRISLRSEREWLQRQADSERQTLEQAKRSADRAEQTATRALESFVERVVGKGYTTSNGLRSGAQCEALSVKADDVPSAPPVPRKDVEAEARKICVWRLNESVVEHGSLVRSAPNLPELAKNTRFDQHQRLGNRYARFIKEAKRALGEMGKNYKPPIDVDDMLLINAEAGELKIAYYKGDKSAAPALLDAGLDTYFGCVTDTERHLVTALRAWEKAKREGPERRLLLEEALHKECRSRFDQLAKAKEANVRAARDWAEYSERKPGAVDLPALPTGPQQVNFNRCES